MDAIPSHTDVQFQAFIAKLLTPPMSWSEKQQMELEMARSLSDGMRELVEQMRDGEGGSHLEQCLVLLKYAKVLDFIMSSLSERRDINPQTLRVVFKLAQLPVHEAYPD